MIKTDNVIGNLPAISAIYFALLQSGYDYYSLGRTQEQIKAVKSFYKPELSSCFFSQAKQNTCETYLYWPRSALLESAVFYINSDMSQFSDFKAYKRFVMSASNLQDTERDDSFWSWMSAFPGELNKVINSEHFKEYLKWENVWIEQQNKANAKALTVLQDIIKKCIKQNPECKPHTRGFFGSKKCTKKILSMFIIFNFTIFVNIFYNFPLLPPSFIPANTLVSKE